ncbi:regulatory solute carrier family 1 member 1 isoform X1 [Pelobates cultripes]|uniref:Protein DDI1 homolog 2 n=1 Tax=Pelobates cultripes TaxID=61616 RepID=A0AAD1T3D3_PELCU|nr:regulatory solute carrier family 1 member 1 isoform X1 [Pelobates cultripes]
MLLTVYCVRRDLTEITFSLEVDGDFELENFRALCELESGIPAAETQIVYAERPLTDNQRSLSSYGLKDGDVVVLRQTDPIEPRASAPFPGLPRIDFSSIAVPGTSGRAAPTQPAAPPPDSSSFPQGLDNPTLLREMLLANPHELSLLKERNPPLAEALLSGDIEKFTKVLLEQQQERARREQERIRLFSADPFDLEAQAKIEEDIRQQNIEENMTIAMEEAPESFGQVVMLYINCKVNGYPVKAFVDSGAQMTIMSQACAERCHIMRLVDRRWAGIAKGVGTQKIIGRVHLAQVQIEGDFLPCSFSILEEQPMDMLLGLDMLKRHQCSIDLEKNVLVIGTTGTRTSFLPEGELPECARLAYGPGRDDMHTEEIADRELAEVLQKSAEEADKETTSQEDLSLTVPSDGLLRPVHLPGIASEPVAHSASTICSGPSTVTESTEPPTNPPIVEASRAESLDLTEADLQTVVPPFPVIDPVAGENSIDLDLSHIAGADQTDGCLQVIEKPMSTPENEDRSLPDSSNNRPSLEPIQSKASQNCSPMQDQADQLQLCLDDLSNCSRSCQDFGDRLEALSVDAEAPMDVDLSTANSIDDAGHRKPSTTNCDRSECTPQQENGDSNPNPLKPQVTFSSATHFLDGEVYEEVNTTSNDISPLPLHSPNRDLEENCFSLATALKELHKLLVMSGKGSSRTLHEKATDFENTDHGMYETSCQNKLPSSQLNQNEAVSDAHHFADDEGVSFDIKDGGGSSDQGPTTSGLFGCFDKPISAEGLDLSDSNDPLKTKVESFTDFAAGDTPDTHNNEPTLNNSKFYMENPETTSNNFTQHAGDRMVKSSDTKDLVGDVTVSGFNNETNRDQDDQSAASSSPPHSPLAFSPSDIERVVSAGFSLQDAVLALENADGNADLALLALLVKNIAVPP